MELLIVKLVLIGIVSLAIWAARELLKLNRRRKWGDKPRQRLPIHYGDRLPR